MTIPQRVREEVRTRLWTLADQLDWVYLPSSQKSKYYEQWTVAPAIGGVLSRYIDKGRVRVYIKDTLLKDYARLRSSSDERPLRAVGVPLNAPVAERYVKPHGLQLTDGRLICWGRADEWKNILMALFERSHLSAGSVPFAAVFLGASGRMDDVAVRSMVENAANRLGVLHVMWLGP